MSRSFVFRIFFLLTFLPALLYAGPVRSSSGKLSSSSRPAPYPVRPKPVHNVPSLPRTPAQFPTSTGKLAPLPPLRGASPVFGSTLSSSFSPQQSPLSGLSSLSKPSPFLNSFSSGQPSPRIDSLVSQTKSLSLAPPVPALLRPPKTGTSSIGTASGFTNPIRPLAPLQSVGQKPVKEAGLLTKVNPEQQFNLNSDSLLNSKPITTWYPANLGKVGTLQSGQPYTFGLHRTSDNTGLSLYPKAKGTSENSDGINARWLSTRDAIEVDAHKGPGLIFTPQLDGCSLYSCYNKDKNTLKVFHHYREWNKDGPGQQTLTRDPSGKYLVQRNGKTEKYDDVLAWERYGAGTQQQSTGDALHKAVTQNKLDQKGLEHLRNTHTTAFLSRDPDGQWYHNIQKFRHNQMTDKNQELNGFQLESFQKTKVAGVPPTTPALLPPPKAYQSPFS